jgi:hypothetical protein
MPRRLFTTYTMLPRGGSGAPPPPLPPRPQEPAPPQGEEKEDSDEEEFLAQLPTDAEAEEATVEQRAILESFETQRHDQSAQELMCPPRGGRKRLGWQRTTLSTAPTPIAATSKRRGLRWRRLSDASSRRT